MIQVWKFFKDGSGEQIAKFAYESDAEKFVNSLTIDDFLTSHTTSDLIVVVALDVQKDVIICSRGLHGGEQDSAERDLQKRISEATER